jgi:hypothetical protein
MYCSIPKFFIPNTMVLSTSHSRAFLSKYLITEKAVTSSNKKECVQAAGTAEDREPLAIFLGEFFAHTSFALHCPLLVWWDSVKNVIWCSHLFTEECKEHFYLIADWFKCVPPKTGILNLLETQVNVA